MLRLANPRHAQGPLSLCPSHPMSAFARTNPTPPPRHLTIFQENLSPRITAPTPPSSLSNPSKARTNLTAGPWVEAHSFSSIAHSPLDQPPSPPFPPPSPQPPNSLTRSSPTTSTPTTPSSPSP